MALNIKDPTTDELARRLSNTTGETITVAVRTALEERIARLEGQRRRAARAHRLRHYIERARARKIIDERSADEILGYDDVGVPR